MAKLSEKFEARGSEAVESAFARRSSCPSDARLSPGRGHCRERRWHLPNKPARLGRAARPAFTPLVAPGQLGELATDRAASAPTRRWAERGGSWLRVSGSGGARPRRCSQECGACGDPGRSGARGREPHWLGAAMAHPELHTSRCPLEFWDFYATGLPSSWQPPGG